MRKKFLLLSILLNLFILPITGYGQDLRTAPTVPIFGPDGVIEQITNILFSFLIFASVISFLYAGYLFISAAGDPTKFDTAKKAVLYGVIGLLIAFSSKGIVTLIDKLFAPQPLQPPSLPPILPV